MSPPKILINPKGALRIKEGHPWVFRSDLVGGSDAPPGAVVEVFTSKNHFLGQAFFNPRSQITLRMLTRGREEIGREFWRKRIGQAVERRREWAQKREATRLIFGEADFLPSLILDQYRDLLVFQTLSAGMDRFREQLIDLFEELFSPTAIIERNDPPVRDREGLPRQRGIVRGGIPGNFGVREGENVFLVDPLEGQKTGLFLDQSENHLAILPYSRGRVLDLFCYQGGFALAVASKADEVIAVDSSQAALEILRRNGSENRRENIQPREANGFDFLRECQNRRELFDVVILDPPPFVRDRKNRMGALRGYKEINLRAIKILRPGGILITCSCSQNFSPEDFLEMLLGASHDTGREIQVLERRGAAPDHPVFLTFPESSYLQCWILRVL